LAKHSLFAVHFLHATVCHGADLIPVCADRAEICCNHSSRTDFDVVSMMVAMTVAKVGRKLAHIQNRIQLQNLKKLGTWGNPSSLCDLILAVDVVSKQQSITGLQAAFYGT
jgi:hypothetical protein